MIPRLPNPDDLEAFIAFIVLPVLLILFILTMAILFRR